MIEVRIRHEDSGRAVHLGEVPFTADGLDQGLDLVSRWGVVIDGENYFRDNLCGQIAVDGTAAYFEIVATDE